VVSLQLLGSFDQKQQGSDIKFLLRQ